MKMCSGSVNYTSQEHGDIVTPCPAEALFREEWRVVHMDAEFGFDRTSADYPTRELAEQVWSGRGGTLQRRLVAATEWEDVG